MFFERSEWWFQPSHVGDTHVEPLPDVTKVFTSILQQERKLSYSLPSKYSKILISNINYPKLMVNFFPSKTLVVANRIFKTNLHTRFAHYVVKLGIRLILVTSNIVLHQDSSSKTRLAHLTMLIQLMKLNLHLSTLLIDLSTKSTSHLTCTTDSYLFSTNMNDQPMLTLISSMHSIQVWLLLHFIQQVVIYTIVGSLTQEQLIIFIGLSDFYTLITLFHLLPLNFIMDHIYHLQY